MKTAYGRLAILTALALAGVAALVPDAPARPSPASAEPSANPEQRVPTKSVFDGTAIGLVLEANGNEVPKNGEQLMAALEKLGEFAQLPVTFSAVALHTGLSNPRVVLTPRPSLANPGPKGADPTAAAPNFVPVVAPVSAAAPTKPNLEGRLFLAANTEAGKGGPKVKTVEFISWNSRKKRFDFGFIEFDETEPQIRVVDGVKCFSCHKNRGPILSLGPWSNTTHNDVVRAAVFARLKLTPGDLVALGPNGTKVAIGSDVGQPRRLDTGFLGKGMRAATFDGVSVFLPQGPAVDAGVRLGAELVRDREVFRYMARTTDGRRGLVVLMGAIAAPGPINENNERVRTQLNREFIANYSTFADNWQRVHKNSSSTLVDFNPSGSMGKLQSVVTQSSAGWGGGSTLQSSLQIVWGGSPDRVTEYDTRRADGEHGLPSKHQPSNPKAFVPASAPKPPVPSAAVSAQALARVIGLTEGDREFLATKLAEAAERVGRPKVTIATLAKDVFGGPAFADVLEAGDLPDREDFKDRFVRGLNLALKAHKAEELKVDRRDYASGPNFAPVPGKEELEPPVVATTACLRCHDVRGAGKAAFSPIPALAFDPFDQTSRDAWLKATDARKRPAVLARLLKRLAEDKDMPPEDAIEYGQFREKNPAAFDAAKDWLEAELKKAKGE
jgi:hypothetical protein